MTQKFYLHDAASTVAGTLPSGTIGTATANQSATGASTNRAMDGTTGTSQTSAAVNTQAVTTTQRSWFRRWISPPLAAHAFNSVTDNWVAHLASSESNTNSNLGLTFAFGIWRPSTGALVSRFVDVGANGSAEPSTIETTSTTGVSAGTFTSADGDVLVFELWGIQTQAKATSYANTVYYDGTIEDSAISCAAYLLAPVDLALYTGPAAAASLVLDERRVRRNHLLRR